MQISNNNWRLISGNVFSENITADGYYVLDNRYVEFDAVSQCFVKASGTGTFNISITPYLSAFIEDGIPSLISVDTVKVITGTGTVYGNLENTYSYKGEFVIQVSGLLAGQVLNVRVYK